MKQLDGSEAVQCERQNAIIYEGIQSVSFNEIGEGGARALATSLSQPVCAVLELRAGTNDIGVAGVTALCRALTQNTRQVGLYIRKNGFGDFDAQVLGAQLPRMHPPESPAQR